MRIAAIVFLSCVNVLINCPTSAQSPRDAVNQFRDILRQGIAQATQAEWRKLSEKEIECFAKSLQQRGLSIANAIQNGMLPSDPRIADVRTACRAEAAQSAPLGQTSQTGTYYVANTLPPDPFLALRTAPSAEVGQRIMKMRNGTVLQILQRRTDGWWFVRVLPSGEQGWALSGQANVSWIICCANTSPTQNDQPARTYWNLNGSMMYLIVSGAERQFYYKEPREEVRKNGGVAGSVSFNGSAVNGLTYEGTLYYYHRQCGRVAYPARGSVLDNYSRVTLQGRAPILDDQCRVRGFQIATSQYDLLQPQPSFVELPAQDIRPQTSPEVHPPQDNRVNEAPLPEMKTTEKSGGEPLEKEQTADRKVNNDNQSSGVIQTAAQPTQSSTVADTGPQARADQGISESNNSSGGLFLAAGAALIIFIIIGLIWKGHLPISADTTNRQVDAAEKPSTEPSEKVDSVGAKTALIANDESKVVAGNETGSKTLAAIPDHFITRNPLTLLDGRIFAFDDSGAPVTSSSISYLSYSSIALVTQPAVLGLFSTKQLAKGLVYELSDDVRCIIILDQASETKTMVGKTIGRMALSGLATKLIVGRDGSGLGGALMDYRLAGKDEKTITNSDVRIIFHDLSHVDLRLSEAELNSICSAVNPDVLSEEVVESTVELLDKIERMAADGPRIYPELNNSILSLRKKIDSATRKELNGSTFKERDGARRKLETLRKQLRDEEAMLPAVRYLIETNSIGA